MPRFRCIRPSCGRAPKGFEFISDYPECPRCKGKSLNHIQPLIDHHFIVLDPMGPIAGQWGRQRMACQPKREYLALHSRDYSGMATDDPRIVTCKGCRATQEWKDEAARWAQHDMAWACKLAEMMQ